MRLFVAAILILALFNLPSWAASRGAHEGGESSSEGAGYSSASHASGTLQTEEVGIPVHRSGGGCSDKDGSYMPVLSGHRPVVSRHDCTDKDSEPGRARCER